MMRPMAPQVPPLEDDIRWRRLTRTGLRCGSCDELHKGLFDLAADAPAQWSGTEDPEPNSALGDRTTALTHDFCVIEGQGQFVRCVLRLPIMGGKDEFFGYGVWSSLSAKNFEIYRDTFDSREQGELGPWFGWFCSNLKGYPETVGMKCKVHPQSEGKRPLIELEPTDHPLSVEQRDGVTLDRLLEIFALNGHDLR